MGREAWEPSESLGFPWFLCQEAVTPRNLIELSERCPHSDSLGFFSSEGTLSSLCQFRDHSQSFITFLGKF